MKTKIKIVKVTESNSHVYFKIKLEKWIIRLFKRDILWHRLVYDNISCYECKSIDDALKLLEEIENKTIKKEVVYHTINNTVIAEKI